jgi:hypothetical protein
MIWLHYRQETNKQLREKGRDEKKLAGRKRVEGRQKQINKEK